MNKGLSEHLVNLLISDLEESITPSKLYRASDTVADLIEIHQIGIVVFDGDAKSLKNWLQAYVKPLGAKPIDLLQQVEGIGKVKTLLLQMELGIQP